MYAIPALLALATLVALVYLPKIRKPALWTFALVLVLGGIAAIGLWAWTKHEDRLRDRELSYLVDHAIRVSPPCSPDNHLTDAERAYFKQQSAAGVPADQIAAAVKVQREAFWTARLKAGAKPGAILAEITTQRRATPEEVEKAGRPMAFDPANQAVLEAQWEAAIPCSEELPGGDFISSHRAELNAFIERNPDDSRVSIIQRILKRHGIEYRKTCKNLRDEESDDYELHQQGCK